MKLLAELIFIQRVKEGLVEFLLVELIGFNKEVLDLVIIILVPCPLLEDAQNLDLGHRIEGKYRVLPFDITRKNIPDRL